MNRISTRRAAQLKEYAKVKAKFLLEHVYCERCNNFIEPRFRDLHHFRGRSNKLLCWIPGFMLLCRGCHTWVHNNVKEAQKLGLIAGAGEWGVMPR